MKSDTERKKYHSEPLHRRKNRMHAHLSKELRSRLKSKRRAVSIRKGDTVKVMRGPHRGKEAKVGDVNVVRRKVFLEGVVVSNARGREVPVPLEPSNLLLIALESTDERKAIFSEEAFRRKEPPKKEAPKPEEGATKEASAGAAEPAKEARPGEEAPAKEEKPKGEAGKSHEGKGNEPSKTEKERPPVNKPQEAHKEHRPAHSR